MGRDALMTESMDFEILFNPEDRLVRLIWRTVAKRGLAGERSHSIDLKAGDALVVGRDLLGRAREAAGTFTFRLQGMPGVMMPADEAVSFFEKLVRAAETANNGIN